jgi:hypothetical protein
MGHVQRRRGTEINVERKGTINDTGPFSSYAFKCSLVRQAAREMYKHTFEGADASASNGKVKN